MTHCSSKNQMVFFYNPTYRIKKKCIIKNSLIRVPSCRKSMIMTERGFINKQKWQLFLKGGKLPLGRGTVELQKVCPFMQIKPGEEFSQIVEVFNICLKIRDTKVFIYLFENPSIIRNEKNRARTYKYKKIYKNISEET